MITVKRPNMTITAEHVTSRKRNLDGFEYDKKADDIRVIITMKDGKVIRCENATLDSKGNIDMHQEINGRKVKIDLSTSDMAKIKAMFDEREKRKTAALKKAIKIDKDYEHHRRMMRKIMNP